MTISWSVVSKKIWVFVCMNTFVDGQAMWSCIWLLEKRTRWCCQWIATSNEWEPFLFEEELILDSLHLNSSNQIAHFCNETLFLYRSIFPTKAARSGRRSDKRRWVFTHNILKKSSFSLSIKDSQNRRDEIRPIIELFNAFRLLDCHEFVKRKHSLIMGKWRFKNQSIWIIFLKIE